MLIPQKETSSSHLHSQAIRKMTYLDLSLLRLDFIMQKQDDSSQRILLEDSKNAPYTLNHYSYCFGNPVGFSDKNGKLPGWMEDAWDTACYVAGDVKDAASDTWDATCDFAGDVKDVACDVWNNYVYGTEETVSYSNTTTYADGLGGASQTVSHQETVHDDGFRLFKVSTNTNSDTDEVSKSFSINLKALFGGSDHETGASAKVSVGLSSKGSFSASASAKVSVDGAHLDGSASASISVDKGATADAHAVASAAYALYSGDASLLEQTAENADYNER